VPLIRLPPPPPPYREYLIDTSFGCADPFVGVTCPSNWIYSGSARLSSFFTNGNVNGHCGDGDFADLGPVGPGPGLPKSGIASLSQTVSIPNNIPAATLSYWVRVLSREPAQLLDVLSVNIYSGNGVQPVDTFARQATNLDGTAGPALSAPWIKNVLDLSAFRGQTITILFQSENHGAVSTHFHIDNVNLTNQPVTDKDYLYAVC
jgi:hypothetical protein